jgi:hypothetical protein
MSNLGFSAGYKLALSHVAGFAAPPRPPASPPPPLPQCEERRRGDQWHRRSIFIARKRTNDHGQLSRGVVVQVLMAGAAIAAQTEITNFTVGASNQLATFSVPAAAIAIAVITALGQPDQAAFFGKYDEPAEGSAKPEAAKSDVGVGEVLVYSVRLNWSMGARPDRLLSTPFSPPRPLMIMWAMYLSAPSL